MSARDSHIAYHDFDVFIVSEKVHTKMSVCPSCDSPAEARMVESIGGGYQRVYGDLMQCPDCEDHYVIVEDPKVDFPLPIRTRWSVPQIVFEDEDEDSQNGIVTNPE